MGQHIHTCVEAYELEEGYVGMSQHFALLRPGGCAAHFQPNNPIFDRRWCDKGACRIPAQGSIVFWVYEMGDVLLTAHLHLHNVTGCKLDAGICARLGVDASHKDWVPITYRNMGTGD